MATGSAWFVTECTGVPPLPRRHITSIKASHHQPVSRYEGDQMRDDRHDDSQGRAAAAIEDADAGSNHEVGVDGDDESNADRQAHEGVAVPERPQGE